MASRTLLLTGVILILSTLTAAAPADLQVFPEQPGVEVNSHAQYQIDVTNPGTSETTYTLSSEESALTIAPQQVTVPAGETERVNAWFNPDQDMPTGTYTWVLEAESREGETTSITMSADIIRDHQVSVETAEEIVTCLDETRTLEIEVTNDGIQSETFEIITRAGEPETQEVTLEPDETRTLEIDLHSDAEQEEEFDIIATSTSSYAQETTSVQWNVENCYESSLSSEESVSGPALATTQTTIELENLGTREDTFEIEASMGDLSSEEITLGPEETSELELSLTPERLMEESVEVTAEGESSASAEFEFNAYNGMESSINFESENPSTCQEFGEENESIIIENTGEVTETFNLSSETGDLELEQVTLEPEETATTNLTINPSEMHEEGSNTLSVASTATSFGEPESTASTEIELKNCFDAELNVVPEITSTGEDRSTLYEIQVTNTGTRTNTFHLSKEGPEWTSISPEEVEIQPGQTRIAYLYAAAPFEKEGEVKITVIAEGQEVVRERTVELKIDEEVEEAITSDRDLTRFTGRFTDSISGITDRIPEVDLNLPVDWRLAVSILVGLLLALGVLYS